MLSIFRKAPHQPYLLRGLSTSHILSKTKNLDNFAALADLLNEEAERQPSPPKKKASFAASNAPRWRDTNIVWKPFMPGYFVRPHELTYKSRFKSPRIPLKRPAVGPGSAEARYHDVFHQLGIDPLSQALNPALLAGFMSEMGKIYGRNMTGLTSKSQRRVGKAIRRAKMMGVIPILSKPSSHLRTSLPKRR